MRGGERVLEEFCRIYPNADLFTIVHRAGSVSPIIENRRVFESPVAKLPFARRKHQVWLPLFPWAVESFDLRGYDLVISTSHCVAKGVITQPDALHVSYVHTPMRYVWDMRNDYLNRDSVSVPFLFFAGWAAHYLRNWDMVSSSRVDQFVANSRHVQQRIMKYYRRESVVVYPPVDVDEFSVGNGTGGYFLVVSALEPYKRVDLAVEACSSLAVKLLVVGSGSQSRRLRRMAGNSVQFTESAERNKLPEIYRNASALLFPGEEDFGIVPVEAQASGIPVIAYGRGGATETIIDSGEMKTGVFFKEQTAASLAEAIRGFDAGSFNPHEIRRNAERFNRQRFIREIKEVIMKSRGGIKDSHGIN